MALDLWYLSVNEHVLNNYWMRFCDIQNNQGRGKGYRLRLINSSLATFVDLFVFCILVFNYFFDDLLGQRSKPGSHVFASSLTASNTKRANLTWLPLEIMHRGHTWHDYSWPWVSFTWLLYNLQLDYVPGADFKNSLYAFGQSEKR